MATSVNAKNIAVFAITRTRIRVLFYGELFVQREYNFVRCVYNLPQRPPKLTRALSSPASSPSPFPANPLPCADTWCSTPPPRDSLHHALMSAAQCGHDEVVRLLASALGGVDTPYLEGLTALMVAAQEGHVGAVQELLNAGADVTCVEKSGRTALMIGCSMGQVDVVEVLLGAGAHVDGAGMDGVTPLMLAVAGEHVGVVEVLLKAGANVDLADWEAAKGAEVVGVQ